MITKSKEQKIRESFKNVKLDIESITQRIDKNEQLSIGINNSINEWLVFLNNKIKAIEQRQNEIEQMFDQRLKELKIASLTS